MDEDHESVDPHERHLKESSRETPTKVTVRSANQREPVFLQKPIHTV